MVKRYQYIKEIFHAKMFGVQSLTCISRKGIFYYAIIIFIIPSKYGRKISNVYGTIEPLSHLARCIVW
jgi:hypothetical protein